MAQNVLIRLPVSLKEELAREAKTEGVSFNQYVLYLLSSRHSGKAPHQEPRHEKDRD